MRRKPYKAVMADDWYAKHPYYRRYMLRELTCIGIGLYVINLMVGVVALANSQAAWLGWVAWQRNPLLLALALLALCSALLHTLTWFKTMPKIIKIPQGDHFVADNIILTAIYLVFAAVSIGLLGLVYLLCS